MAHKVIINPNPLPLLDSNLPVYLDCETDEKDNFVGIGLTQDGNDVFYLTKLEYFKPFEKYNLIGHNLKFDAHLLHKWGIPIKPEQLIGDTMLMSYSLYGSSVSHSLKSLAKDLLNMQWSTYKEMITIVEEVTTYQKYDTWVTEDGKRRRKKRETPLPVVKTKTSKTTLDKLPVEKVAAYCCSDVWATYMLYRHFSGELMSENQYSIYDTIELPTMRVIYSMENRGIKLNVAALGKLDTKVKERIQCIIKDCKQYAGDINIGSSKQLAPILESMGFWLPTTSKGNKSVKKAVLEMYKTNPFVALLLEHSMLKKLYTSFTRPLSELKTLPRVYPTFNQVTTQEEEQIGISTGRLSCSKPNLQQIPIKSDIAKDVRSLFIPDKKKVLIVADFSQIEPRILAHVTQDKYLQDVFNNDQDIYMALIKGTPWEHQLDGRDIAKVFYLALSYGARAKKLAKVFKCSVEEAQQRMDQCWKNIPQVKQWKINTILEARKNGHVNTLYGRIRYLPDIDSEDFFIRCSEERKAINTPIQGTAADVMKMTMVALHKAGYPIQLVVHDEVILSVDEEDVELAMDDIKHIMENIVKLDVPLKVEIKQGDNWNEAKS